MFKIFFIKSEIRTIPPAFSFSKELKNFNKELDGLLGCNQKLSDIVWQVGLEQLNIIKMGGPIMISPLLTKKNPAWVLKGTGCQDRCSSPIIQSGNAISAHQDEWPRRPPSHAVIIQ